MFRGLFHCLLDFHDVHARALGDVVRVRFAVVLSIRRRVHDDFRQAAADGAARQSTGVDAHDAVDVFGECFQVTRHDQHVRGLLKRQILAVTRVQARRRVRRVQRVRAALRQDVLGETREAVFGHESLGDFLCAQMLQHVVRARGKHDAVDGERPGIRGGERALGARRVGAHVRVERRRGLREHGIERHVADARDEDHFRADRLVLEELVFNLIHHNLGHFVVRQPPALGALDKGVFGVHERATQNQRVGIFFAHVIQHIVQWLVLQIARARERPAGDDDFRPSRERRRRLFRTRGRSRGDGVDGFRHQAVPRGVAPAHLDDLSREQAVLFHVAKLQAHARAERTLGRALDGDGFLRQLGVAGVRAHHAPDKVSIFVASL